MGPYDGVEIGYPSMWEDLLFPYTDNDTDRTPVICGTAPDLYVNVPPHVVRAVIDKHAGLASNSGKLPPMIETDENGCLWAAAAEIPSDLSGEEESEEEESEEEEVVVYGSPASMVTMGLPPPPPPPLPPAIGALNPPTPLTAVDISPIAKTQDDGEDF